MTSRMQRAQKLLVRVGRRMDNLLNPIMAKEMYQSVHSRAFMISFWLLSGIALLIYLSAWNSRGNDIGAGMFAGFSVLMAFMGMILLPLGAFFGLRKEITTRTLELVQITGINARRLARGRMLAVSARLVLLCSMLAPFAALSYLFGGIDVLEIAAITYTLMLGSLLMCALGVWCASLSVYPRLRHFSRFAFPFLMLSSPIFLPVFGSSVFFFSEFADLFDMGGHWTEMLMALGLMTTLCALLIMFLLAGAANALTFPQNRSSARAKFLALLIVLTPLVFLILKQMVSGGGHFDEEICFTICLCNCIFLFPCALVWITAAPQARRKRGTRGLVARLLPDGPTATIGYLLLTVAALFALCAALLTVGGSASENDFIIVICILAITLTYIIYPTAVAWIVTQWLPARLRTPTTRRGVLLLFIIANLLLFAVLFAASQGDWDPPESLASLTVFFPVLYGFHIAGRYGFEIEEVIVHMGGPCLLGLVYYTGRALRALNRRREQEQGAEEQDLPQKAQRTT